MTGKRIYDTCNPLPFVRGIWATPSVCWLIIIWELLEIPSAIVTFAQTCKQALRIVCACFSVCPSWQRFKIFAKFASVGIKLKLMEHKHILGHHFIADNLHSFRDGASPYSQLRELHFHHVTLMPDDISEIIRCCTTIKSLAFHGATLIPESQAKLKQM